MVANGGALFSPGIVQKILGYLNTPSPDVPEQLFGELTSCEYEVLEMIAQGKTNSEIAALLNLIPKTVSNNISNVLLKVHPTDRAKLILMALDVGIWKVDQN